MKTIGKILTGFLIVSFISMSCIDDFKIEGNGIIQSEGRTTPDFTSVSSEGEFDVTIKKGTDFKITVTSESNILPFLETKVTNNKLHIFISRLYRAKNTLPMEIKITMPSLDDLVQSGSGSIKTDKFTPGGFTVVVSGSGNIETAVNATIVDGIVSGSGILEISGSTNSSKLLVSGSGSIKSDGLSVNDCNATISGSGSMWVNVSKTLNAIISGSGNVYLNGNPEVETRIFGTGNVIRK